MAKSESLMEQLLQIKPEGFASFLEQHEASLIRSKRPFTDYMREKFRAEYRHLRRNKNAGHRGKRFKRCGQLCAGLRTQTRAANWIISSFRSGFGCKVKHNYLDNFYRRCHLIADGEFLPSLILHQQ